MKIYVKPFNWNEHHALLESWFVARGEDIPPWEFIPPTGFVVYHELEAICAGFMTKTDANTAIITNFISTPMSSKVIRKECLSFLAKLLDSYAGAQGFKLCVLSTAAPTMIELFQELNYKPILEKTLNLGRSLWHGYL